MNKDNILKWATVGAVVLVLVFAVALTSNGQSTFWGDVADKVAVILAGKVDAPAGPDLELGASGTRFPNGISADTTSPVAGEVRGTTITSTGTTTIQEVLLGSRYSEDMVFTAGSATGTPGVLFSLLNSGNEKICSGIVIDLDTQVEGSMVFAASTSTSALACSSGTCGGLIASTTVATGTKPYMAGKSGTTYWLWPNGTYILGGLAASFTTATSTDYSSASGEVYVECFSE